MVPMQDTSKVKIKQIILLPFPCLPQLRTFTLLPSPPILLLLRCTANFIGTPAVTGPRQWQTVTIRLAVTVTI